MYVFQKIGNKEEMVRSFHEKPLIIGKEKLDKFTIKLITMLFHAKDLPIAMKSRAYVAIVDENGIVEIQERLLKELHLLGIHITTLHQVKMQSKKNILACINEAVNDYWKKKVSRAMKELMIRVPGVQDLMKFPWEQQFA